MLNCTPFTCRCRPFIFIEFYALLIRLNENVPNVGTKHSQRGNDNKKTGYGIVPGIISIVLNQQSLLIRDQILT